MKNWIVCALLTLFALFAAVSPAGAGDTNALCNSSPWGGDASMACSKRIGTHDKIEFANVVSPKRLLANLNMPEIATGSAETGRISSDRRNE